MARLRLAFDKEKKTENGKTWMFRFSNSPSAVNVAARLPLCCSIKIVLRRKAYLLA
jgi:hypothetical protein